MELMTILLCYGTRPEWIKIKPLIDEMGKVGINYKTLFTGQHKDIVNDKADFVLDMSSNNSNNRLDEIISGCMNLDNKIFDGITHVLVQGDTTSVVGLAMSALHRKIKVIHLEAGLRTYDYENPFPEENNRRIVSTIASIHLCPTEQNKQNLLGENVVGDIHVVGNTVLDNLLHLKEKVSYKPKVLITLHRRENHHWMDRWFIEIDKLARENKSVEFILPIHPNPNVQKHKHLLQNVNVIDPLSHSELLDLLVECSLVITDSGGIQEECSFFNKKCLVCRKITERPESVNITSFMINNPSELYNYFNIHYNSINKDTICPYGDGHSSERICEILKNNYE